MQQGVVGEVRVDLEEPEGGGLDGQGRVWAVGVGFSTHQRAALTR